MVSLSFEQAKVNDFSKAVTALVTQSQSFFKPYVKTRMVTGEFFEVQTIGSVEASYKTEYNQKVEYKDISHARRGKSLETIFTPVLIDKQQFSEALINIDSDYTEQVANSMIRELDRMILAGGLGTFQSGKNFGTTNTWTDVTSGDAQNTFDFSGGALSLANCYSIIELMMNRGFGVLANSNIYMTVTPKQAMDLMRDGNKAKTEIYPVSHDGEKATGVGPLKFIIMPTSPEQGTSILPIESSKRVGMVFTDNAIELGISKDVAVNVYDESQYVESYAIKSVGRMGALRVADTRVLKLLMQP